MTAAAYGVAYDVLQEGVELGDHAPTFYADVERVESLGFDSIWFGETHRRKPGHGHVPAPLVIAGAVAARTERLHIGTAVLLLPASTPLQIAEQVAIVDHLSRGRFTLGVAPGLEVFNDFGWVNFAFERTQMSARMDESLAVLRGLWSNRTFSFEGTYHRYEDAACFPGPWTPGGPPILVGGITAAAIARAANSSSGWVGGTPYPFDLIVNVRRRYLDAVATAGGEPGPFALIRPLVVAPTDTEARELAWRWTTPLIDYYLARGAYIGADFAARRDPDDAVRTEALTQVPIVGDVAGCVEQIRRYQELAGVDHFIFRVRFPDQSDAERDRMLDLIGAELLPALREQHAVEIAPSPTSKES